MDESASYTDSSYGIPVFSLYGEVRRPTPDMVSTFDVLLFDLQDAGWRRAPDRGYDAPTVLLEGTNLCYVRPCFFQPFFDKHVGTLCSSAQIHVDFHGYDPVAFRPYRFISALFKSMRVIHPEFELWRNFHYEYEPVHRWPVDVINGGPALRVWVDDPKATMRDGEDALRPDEQSWAVERAPFLLYGDI